MHFLFLFYYKYFFRQSPTTKTWTPPSSASVLQDFSVFRVAPCGPGLFRSVSPWWAWDWLNDWLNDEETAVGLTNLKLKPEYCM